MQLVWFRQDLRVADNLALSSAMLQGATLAIYLVSPLQWKTHNDAPIKLDFQLRNLLALADRLQELNVPLVVLRADLWEAIPEVLLGFCQQYKVSQLHFSENYGVNEQSRDQACIKILQEKGVKTSVYQGDVLLAPGKILNQQNQMYKVFTAFKKACFRELEFAPIEVLPVPSPQKPLAIASDLTELSGLLPIYKNQQNWDDLWPAGEKYAEQLLADFCENSLANYQQNRDFPSLDATSKLSPYLAAGVLSVQTCWQRAISYNQGEMQTGCLGAQTWLTELLWREFYRHLLALNPALSKHQAFLGFEPHITWRNAPEDLQAWQQGRTGFPLIDAAMRQLNAIGWMHNRLRMVVAMFLTKNLLIDWRLGEKWFMQHLIDGDLAANNGGWQWCASTGTDAAPYFRVFNPLNQSEKFDPNGDFIRFWLPELAHLSNKEIHLPKKLSTDLFAPEYPKYPSPIVDLKASRLRAIEAYKLANSRSFL